MTDLLARIIDAVGFLCGSALFAFLGILPFADKAKEHKRELIVFICASFIIGGATFSALSYKFDGGLPCIVFTVFIMLVFSVVKIKLLSIKFREVYWVECLAIAATALFQAESIGISRLIFGADYYGSFQGGYFAVFAPVAVACVVALIVLIKKINRLVNLYPTVLSRPSFIVLSSAILCLSVAGAVFCLLNITVTNCINEFLIFAVCYLGFTLWVECYDKAMLTAKTAARSFQLERIIDIQKRQYQDVNEQIAKTKVVCHDLKHHMSAIRQLVSDREYEKLCEYLTVYGKSLPDGLDTRECDNAAVDSVAQHYLSLAQNNGISVDCNLQQIDDDCGISSPDLCIVLGNALENAVEAAKDAAPEDKFIRIRCENNPGWITIVIGNGFSVAPVEKNGVFISSKGNNRLGIGTESIREIASKYNGKATFSVKDKLFKVSVILFKQEG